MKEKVFLCDIDGTIASHKDIRSPFDETKVLLDTPIKPTIIVIRGLINAGYHILFVSGRTDACYNDTKEWIQKNIGLSPKYIHLYMRKKGDTRSDDIVKKEILDNHIKPIYEPIGVFDDRLKVCRMWYDEQIFVFNVNQGLKEF